VVRRLLSAATILADGNARRSVSPRSENPPPRDTPAWTPLLDWRRTLPPLCSKANRRPAPHLGRTVTMAVSDETKEFLEQVKKGKPRKFVMLAKGTTIVSLILFKKGTTSKFIKQAKEEGKGVPFFGVVSGKGMDINFQLATTDGFDKPPVK